jgi:hypothetical protein
MSEKDVVYKLGSSGEGKDAKPFVRPIVRFEAPETGTFSLQVADARQVCGK